MSTTRRRFLQLLITAAAVPVVVSRVGAEDVDDVTHVADDTPWLPPATPLASEELDAILCSGWISTSALTAEQIRAIYPHDHRIFKL